MSELVDSLNELYQEMFFSIRVQGEITQIVVRKNHLFFTLKDEESMLQGVLFANYVKPDHLELKDGDRVILGAKLKIWKKKGDFRLQTLWMKKIVEETPSQKQDWEQLKKKLTQEGLFAEERKMPLPVKVSHVAVITSKHSAGWGDFRKILAQERPLFHIHLFHTDLEGQNALTQMKTQMELVKEQANQFDLVCLIRGGGHSEDFSVFQQEEIVRAWASIPLVKISGIGHAKDSTLCDLASDISASTPSNVAQFLFPFTQEAALAKLNSLKQSLRFQSQWLIERMKKQIPSSMLKHLKLVYFYSLEKRQKSLGEYKRKLQEAMRRILEEKKTLLFTWYTQLEHRYPLKELQDHMAILLNADKTPLVESKLKTQVGQTIFLHTKNFELEVVIKKILAKSFSS